MNATETNHLPIDPRALKAALVREFLQGGADLFWTDAEIRQAARRVASRYPIERVWRWAVGISGSFHFVTGSATTREEADRRAAETHDQIRAANPAIGGLPTEVYRETQPQRRERLLRIMQDILDR